MRGLQVLNVLALLMAANASIDGLIKDDCSVWDSDCVARICKRVLPIFMSGIPDIGTQRLDPLYIPYLLVQKNGLKTELENVKITGLQNALLKKASIDKNIKKIRVQYVVPYLVMNCTSTSSGFFHAFPINGKGDVNVRLDNVEIDVMHDYDLWEDGMGRKFMDLKNLYFSFEVVDGVMHSISNLSSGDNADSAAILKYVQENWRSITADYGRPVMEEVQKRIFKALRTVIRVLPLNNIFSDY